MIIIKNKIFQNTKANHLLLAATAQADLERNSQNELLESVIASEKSVG